MQQAGRYTRLLRAVLGQPKVIWGGVALAVVPPLMMYAEERRRVALLAKMHAPPSPEQAAFRHARSMRFKAWLEGRADQSAADRALARDDWVDTYRHGDVVAAPEPVDCIKAYCPDAAAGHERYIVELGAGRGHWAKALREVGVGLVPTDDHSARRFRVGEDGEPGAQGKQVPCVTEVLNMDAGVALRSLANAGCTDARTLGSAGGGKVVEKGMPLLLVYPVAPVCSHVVRSYTGEGPIIYVGEGPGGVNGGQDFFTWLSQRGFEPTMECETSRSHEGVTLWVLEKQ